MTKFNNSEVVKVKWLKFETKADGTFKDWVYSDGLRTWEEGKVYAAHAVAYADLATKSGKLPMEGTDAVALKALTEIPEKHQEFIDLFTTLADDIEFEFVEDGKTATDKYDARGAGIKSVNFKFVNEGDANFATLTGDYIKAAKLTAKASSSIDKTALTSGKKVIPMEMIITDVWGKVMTYEFEVEISL